jgi:hypothetical protein
MTAFAPRSAGPLGTAMRSLGHFARATPGRELFLPLRFRGDLEREAWNEWTILLWVRLLARTVSSKTKRYLKVGTIETRVSLAKGFLSHKYGFAIAGEAPRLRSYLKKLRSGEPLGATRKKRRGLRRKHIKRAWKSSTAVRETSIEALSSHASIATGWHTLARGGEIGPANREDLQFRRVHGRRYAVLWLRPLKKKRGQQHPKLPQFVAEQAEPEEWEPYRSLVRLAEALDTAGCGPSDALFPAKGGKRMTTARYRATVKRYAKIIGFDPKEFGAHSPRIGGAICIAAANGSQLLLQAKGRWASDIGRIYARQTRKMHMAASDLMFRGVGRDLEELFPDFVEPAM